MQNYELLLSDPLISLDDLMIGNRKIFQRQDQFKFSIDAVLLAHFAKCKPRASYVDLGTGTGILPLLATALGAGHVTGLECNPIMADLAKASVAYNGLEEQIRIVAADYNQCRIGRLIPKDNTAMQAAHGTEEMPSPTQTDKSEPAKDALIYIGQKPFDGVLVNPPYYDAEAGLASQSEDVALARQDGRTSLAVVAQSAKRLLKFGGSLWMVYPAGRLPHAMRVLEEEGFALKRMRLVHSFPQDSAKLVLLEAKLGGKPGLQVEPPLYIYEQPGQYTEEVASWYER